MRILGLGIVRSAYSFDVKLGSRGGTALVLDSNKHAWMWGPNNNGELGGNNIISRSSPVSVIGAHAFTLATTGSQMSIGLKANGEVWTWGNSFGFGSLGDNANANRSSPVSVVGNHRFTSISTEGGTCLCLKSDGTVWTWGYNAFGQLGDNSISLRSSPVSVIGSHSFTKISMGLDVSHGLKSNGSVWTWGNDTKGQLGRNTKNVNRSSPVSVVGNHIFVAIEGGASSAMGLKSDGTLWGWGDGAHGQLGTNSIALASSPVPVVGAHSFIFVVAGNVFYLALKVNGQAWGWGINSFGQLAQNDIVDRSSPVQVVGNHSFIAISAGSSGAMGLKSTGEVWSWGYGTSGQVGDNAVISRSSPVLVAKVFT